MSHEPPPSPLADDGSGNLLLQVGLTIRDNFHTLAGLSLVFLAAALPWVVLATLTSWAVAWAPLVLATSPVWAAIVTGADRLLVGEASPWRTTGGDLSRLAWPAVRIGIVPALCGTVVLALGTGSDNAVWQDALLLATLGITAAVVVLLIPAIPLAVRHGLSGPVLWQTSAVVVVRRPMQVLGTVALTGIGLWLTLTFGPAVLLGTAPLGVLVAAITLPDPE